jgi:hypothetical protein
VGEGYQVDPDALAQAGQQVSAQQSQAEGLLGQARGMTVSTRSWGLLGLATTYSKYADLQGQLVDHLGKVGNGVGAIGANLTSTAEQYRAAEATNVQGLQQCSPDSGGPNPPITQPGGVEPPFPPPLTQPGGVEPPFPPPDAYPPVSQPGGVEPDWPTGGPDEQIELV